MSAAEEADEIVGYVKTTLPLPAEDDGELAATLVRALHEGEPHRRAVLYLHGYVDFFFQTHLAEAFVAADFEFFALDLRRYGRSLRPGNVPCQFRLVDEYFTELDWAIESIRARGIDEIHLVAHSTGALIGSIYRKRGKQRSALTSLCLNSPFFEFRANSVERAALAVVRKIGEKSPRFPAPVGLHEVYGKTLHASHSGEWTYDLTKKPLGGFGITAGWLAAISRAHAELQAGLDLDCPVLVLHSTSSHVPGRSVTERDQRGDTVLDVAHMVKFAPQLGSHVTVFAVKDGLHDLVLSAEPVRRQVIERMLEFTRQASAQR